MLHNLVLVVQEVLVVVETEVEATQQVQPQQPIQVLVVEEDKMQMVVQEDQV